MQRPIEDLSTWVADLQTLPGSALSQLELHSNLGTSESYRVCRAALQKAVFAELTISTLCHPDGLVYPCPDGLEEGVLDEQFRDNRLMGLPLDILIDRALVLLINEPPEEARQQLQTLRLRLMRGLDAVDDRLATLGERTEVFTQLR